MDLKDLDKFLKICRKRGVTQILFEGTSVTFGDLPREDSTAPEGDEVQTDEPTYEQMMYAHLPDGGL